MTTGGIARLGDSRAAGYIAALAAVAIAYLLRELAAPILGDSSPFLPFVLPVVFAVLVSGRGPGIVAGVCSLAVGFSLIHAAARFTGSALLQAAIFAFVCAGIGWLDSRRTQQRMTADRANRQLELLVRQTNDYAIFTVDDESRVQSWNSGAERLLGWSRDQILGKSSAIFLPGPNPQEQALAHIAQARREGRFAKEVWQRRADGSEFLANILITPIFDHDGHGMGFAKIVYDTTARRAEEFALRRREEHLKSILATVPDAMVVIDVHGIILSFSPAAERLFGYDEHEVVGENVSMLMPSPDRERHDGYIERYLASGVPRIIGSGRNVIGRRADGTTFPMHLSVGEALAGDQRLFTGFIRDLSEKREFEAKLEELQTELIHVSRVSAMGTMASTLAHELNQPLTAIAAYGEAAAAILGTAQEPDRDTLKELLGEMASQSLRAGSIVRRLREFVSRGELTKTPEYLPGLVEDAAALALVGAKEDGVQTAFRFDPAATPVLVDRIQIQQVLTNLVRNAVEAMSGCAEKKLTIETHLVQPTIVQISVSDTGSGIAPPVRERMFEAFNSSKPAGMGLGLSICRTIVEAHGGKIQALDRAGGGTEFRFTLTRAPTIAELKLAGSPAVGFT